VIICVEDFLGKRKFVVTERMRGLQEEGFETINSRRGEKHDEGFAARVSGSST
jgi:hypothetical protein